MSETNKPVYRLRYGNVVAAVFARNSSSGYFFDTTIKRVFKDNDQWGESAYFSDRDLPPLALLAANIHTWIYQQKAQAVTVTGPEDA